MATTLINIVEFTGLSIGVATAQAHNINIDGSSIEPDLVFASGPGYNVVVGETTVTVTRPADGAATLSVFVWRVHSTPRVPYVLNGVVQPSLPFILQGGTSGGGSSLTGFTGASNTGLGEGAGVLLDTALRGVFVGVNAGSSLVDGDDCTAVGFGALAVNTAQNNTAFGSQALNACTIGTQNTAAGFQALGSLTSGTQNTAFGQSALFNTTTESENTAVGFGAMSGATTQQSVAMGWGAMSGVDGDRNSAFGYTTGSALTTGLDNVLVGFNAGSTLSEGDNNVLIGSAVDCGPTMSGCIVIGRSATGTSAAATGSNSLNFHPALATATGAAVQYNSTTGQMGPLASARRFKENITDIEQDVSKVLELRPVSFNWKPEHMRGDMRTFGFIAEEVAEYFPNLVPRNGDGECMSVNYDQLIVPLIAVVKQQQATIEALLADVAALKG